MVFNRRMISQDITDFTTTSKIVYNSLQEVNCDYEPDEDVIFIGHHSDFYTNNEIAVFQTIPSEDFTIEENESLSINKMNFAYKTYEQDRDSENTTLAIHTESEWSLQNENVENKKEVTIDFIRDSFSIQTIVDLQLQKETTSTNEDDKVYISNVVQLAPSSFNTFGIILLMRISDGKLEILNKTSEGDNAINWLNLGFGVGSAFEITEGSNIGTYTVFAIERTKLTLTPVVGTPTESGDLFIRVKYSYTNIVLATRTFEGFTIGEFPNQAYSIKRNLERFYQYLKSTTLYCKKDITNSFFKSNGTYQSQLSTETTPLIENATITYDSLPDALITPKINNLTAYAEWQDVLNYLDAYKVSRGFIRTFDSNGRVVKGYVKDLDLNWSENSIKLTLEEKFENNYLILTYANGILTVNDTVYNLSGISNWWLSENDLFRFYDNKNRPISNFYDFNFVNLNGVIYSTRNELITALNAL